jgi:hypothetical protein
MDPFEGTYHILLIGIDNYTSRPLAGCVNDIDLIEGLLLDPPGIGVPADRMRVARLAAPRPDRPLRSRFGAETLEPTRANILAAFETLAGPAVTPEDRVLIYYSGHGGQQQWTTRAWHESIVPLDGLHIFDDELNARLHAIAKTGGDKTVDLTVVLDCCHSSGITRDALQGIQDDSRAAVRSMPAASGMVEPPDLSRIPGFDAARNASGPRLRPIDPPYLVLAACQADEVAGEKDLDGLRQGNLTRSLARYLADRSAERRSMLRWGEIWPDLLDHLRTLGATPPITPPQNPWIIGRSERRVFGGAWEPCDIGYPVKRATDGAYQVHAGQLLGVSVGAELALYGPQEPARFPPLGSEADLAARIGRLRVVKAERAQATAEAIEAPAELPAGTRARLVKAGEAGRLRVRLDPFEEGTAAALDASPLVEALREGSLDPEVTVTGSATHGWAIKSELEPFVAGVPAGRLDALRAGLESYAAYNQALRLARELRDPGGAALLAIRLLQFERGGPQDDATIEALPEAPKGPGGDYDLPDSFGFCVEVTNSHPQPLLVTLLNCTAGGKVEYLGAKQVRGQNRDCFWLADEIGSPFESWPSMGRLHATDRILAVGTSRRDFSLESMEVVDNVQDVVDRLVRGEVTRDVRPQRQAAASVEVWTAATTTVRIYQRGQQAV